ncbi:hypothetical protein [Heyndrickxia camelliae]|uniref:Uncharacterized protein n=1 Tax=Heyndrickxia camelliae TaxID=1707093 RepID=A0A2N3LF17_9BACI|nr:hypothetical protein [Heyndrickxia camelliae]PKR83189.1 hypothetical protein CWO92_20300 [Heyndrickxia camelliae]
MTGLLNSFKRRRKKSFLLENFFAATFNSNIGFCPQRNSIFYIRYLFEMPISLFYYMVWIVYDVVTLEEGGE